MRFRIPLRLAAFAGAGISLFGQGAAPDAVRNPFDGNRAAIDAGKQVYASVCQACHGAGARGDRGPSLTGALRHGNSDAEIFRNVRGGIQGTQMPPFPQFTADQIWQVMAYLRSLSGAPDANSVTGDAAAGKAVFEGKGGCRPCHANDLNGAGLMTAQQLRAAVVQPGQRPVVTVRTRDGHEYRGLRMNDDTFSLQMLDTAGQLRSFIKSRVAGIAVDAASVMPADYGQKLTAAEIQNVVAYLKTLNTPVVSAGLTYDRIVKASAEPQNWLTYWGDYAGHHYSPLSQINTSNVTGLQAQWAVQMPGDGTLESTPVVVDGVMYTTGPVGQVFALDAATGRQIWKYQRTQKKVNPYEANRFNRGVAVLDGRVFFGTLDAALVALDARTGRQLWEVQVADTMLGYSLTSAPLALKDKIVTGVSGGEYGISGFLEAYDPATGRKLWRVHSIPAPGEAGHETWPGDSWKHGSGAMWLTGSYDAETNTLFWAVGNPGPDINGDVRRGDNLYTDSVLALDADTGAMRWHYQFTPHDTRDWDATEDFVLVNMMWRGQNRKLLIQANRNGNFYVLDRTSGAFLAAAPYMRTNWVKGWDATGRPITIPAADANEAGAWVYPSLIGGTNFQAPSYSPLTGWLYFAYHDGGQRFATGPAIYEPGKQFQGEGGGSVNAGPPAGDAPETQGFLAFDPETMKVVWKFPVSEASLSAGVLATGGGVVFASSHDGNFIALDSRTGKEVWRFGAGGDVAGSPISYAVDGRQYVAVSSAQVLYSFALPE